jgi:outer membrane receptor for ferrienterochelin and colicins
MPKFIRAFLISHLLPVAAFAQEPEVFSFGKDSMEQVVITGTMRAVKRSASPVPVEVYTPKFFMKNPTPSIFDALQMVNGVRPQLNCNICNTGDIHINGLEGPYTMVLIDGMPIVSSLASVYGLSGIPTALVERIEVVKGPASSLYGSEAIGGLINVITKTPAKAPLLSLDISGTGWQEFNTDIGMKYRAGTKATGLLGINYFNYNNPIDKNKDNYTDVTLQDRFSIFNKLSFNRKNDRIANLAVRYVYEDRWGGEMNWNKNFRGGDSIYGESIYTSRMELIGNYQLPVKEKMIFSYSANRHDQHSAYGRIIFNATQEVAFSQLTWEKEVLKKHTLLMGAVGRYTWYNDNTLVTKDTTLNLDRPNKIFIPGIFVQDEFSIHSKHQFLIGGRYDYDIRHGNILTPRIAYKISTSPNDIIRVNAGTGFRVVNVFTEDHAALTGARSVIIEEELKPEKSYNLNINYLKKIYSQKHWFLFDVSAWFTHFSNRIVPDYTTNSNQIIYKNLDGYSVSKGITANVEYGSHNSLIVTLGATVMDVSITKKNGPGKAVTERQLLTEKWAATWTVSYKENITGITIDYTGNIYGSMLLPLLSDKDPRPAKSPIWSIQNIQFSRKLFNNFQVYTGIKNLLNWTPAKRTPFLIARGNDPFDKHLEVDNPYGLTFDPNYVYAPNQGIRGYLGVRYNIN